MVFLNIYFLRGDDDSNYYLTFYISEPDIPVQEQVSDFVSDFRFIEGLKMELLWLGNLIFEPFK